MEVKIILKSGKEYNLVLKNEDNIDQLVNRINTWKRKFIKFGPIMLNIDEIESINIEPE